jgi:hypothetical protein
MSIAEWREDKPELHKRPLCLLMLKQRKPAYIVVYLKTCINAVFGGTI